MKVAEFVAEILLKGSGKAVQDLRKLSAGIKDMRLGLGAALNDLYKVTSAAREMAVSLDAYQINTGLSATQLQKLSFQASQAGVSMNELGATIQRLQQKNANARLGYGWDPILSRFGLHPGQDPVTQLNQIGNALRRLRATNPAEAHALAMKAGLSDGMYYALMRGTTEQMDKQLIITNKEQQALVKLNQQWNKLWFNLKQIGAKLQALGADMQTRFIKILINATKGFLELATRIHEALEANEKLKAALIAFGVVVMGYFQPWLLALSAIALVLEDIWVYTQGGQSLTGRIVDWAKSSKEFQESWKDVKATLEGISLLFDLIITAVKEVTGLLGKFNGFLDDHPKIKAMIETQKEVLKNMANPVRMVRQGADLAAWATTGVQPIDASYGNFVQYNNHNFEIHGENADETAEKIYELERQLYEAQGLLPVRAQGGKNGGNNYGEK